MEYALGWELSDDVITHDAVLSHSGANPDAHGNQINFSYLWMAPEHDFAVLVATNGGSRSAAIACNDEVTSFREKYLYNK
jgi:hypothetical protein